jgi:hypothetical protein
MRTTIAALAGVTALAIAGCGGDRAPGTPDRTPAPASSTPAAPAYTGPALPGLAAKPAWSVHQEPHGLDQRWVGLGDVVVLARTDTAPAPTATGTSGRQRGSSRAVLEFRDVVTGAVKATVRTPLDSMRRDDWGGKPVLVVSQQVVQPSDGLSEEKLRQIVTGYDATGTKVGEVQADGDQDRVGVAGGRVFRRSDDSTSARGKLSVQPVAGGGGSVELACAAVLCGYSVKADGEPSVQAGGGIPVPATVGDLLFTLEDISGTPRVTRLVALDARTGSRLWTSQTLQAPPGTRPEDADGHLRVRPVRMVGGRLLLSWSSAKDVGPEIAALHDPVTGKLLTTGPELPGRITTVLADKDGKLAVASAGGSLSDVGSAGWDLETGRITWSQEEDEKRLIAISLVNGIIYGQTDSGRASGNLDDFFIAVELATKKVVQQEVKLANAPAGTPAGYGLMLYGDALFAFPPA